MEERFHPRKQGDIGEVEATRWLTRVGAEVFLPFGHSRDADLIAIFDQVPFRVQVKSSGYRKGADGYSVALCTTGGNRSWTGAVRYFDRSRCDFLFVWTTDDRRWFIPATAVDGRRGINVGGRKYSEFEIGPERDSTGVVPVPTMPVPDEGERCSWRGRRACKVRAYG